jgi:hypothetical protein
MMPPVGKSGPCTCAISASVEASGWSSSSRQASISSPALCGGIEVAMPTAMPVVPLASRLGKPAGSTTGSSSEPS